MLPRLRQLEKDLTVYPEAKNLQPKIEQLHTVIEDIESGTKAIELRGFN
jgi:hypothetical protein